MDPKKLWYTKDHEWIGEQDGLFAVGITAHAQDALGDITYVELPDVDRELTAHEESAVVESVKAASDIYAPAAGRVAEVNGALETRPELVNKDPYGEGWFYKLADVDKAGLDDLMDAAGYEAYLTTLDE